jgi:hypothetical protein
VFRGIADRIAEKKGHNEAQRARSENIGILIASGMIAGEGLMGLVVAGFALAEVALPEIFPRAQLLRGPWRSRAHGRQHDLHSHRQRRPAR